MKKLLLFLSLIFTTASYAETQTINWWVGGQSYQTTTCETGGNVTPPATPTKRGHHFTGWEVALYDFSTLDASIGGTTSTYDATNNTWLVEFPYGKVFGKALCSPTRGVGFGQSGAPDETARGQNCWCKATDYNPSSGNVLYGNHSPVWAFHYDDETTNDCLEVCAKDCGFLVRSYLNFRRGLFGITQ